MNLFNTLSTEHILKITKNLRKKKRISQLSGDVWTLFHQNLMLYRMRTFIWPKIEDKVLKTSILAKMYKSSSFDGYIRLPLLNVLTRYFEISLIRYFGLNLKGIAFIGHLWNFWQKNVFHRMLVNTLSTEHILKITKIIWKKSKFLNFRVTFGRSPNFTNGTFLDSISSQFNALSNAHIHLAENGV